MPVAAVSCLPDDGQRFRALAIAVFAPHSVRTSAIIGNSYRMRQHTDLRHVPHAARRREHSHRFTGVRYGRRGAASRCSSHAVCTAAKHSIARLATPDGNDGA